MVPDGPVTVLGNRDVRFGAVVGTVCVGVLAVLPLVAKRYVQQPPVAWAERIPMVGVAAWLAVGAAIVAAGCLRALLMGVRIGPSGVLVRNYFRTYTISWPEAARFANGSTPGGLRALNVVTRGGVVVTASGTGKNGLARHQVVAAIGRAAGRYGIACEVTGMPARWEGPKSRLAPAGLVAVIILGLFLAETAFVPFAYSCSGGCTG